MLIENPLPFESDMSKRTAYRVRLQANAWWQWEAQSGVSQGSLPRPSGLVGVEMGCFLCRPLLGLEESFAWTFVKHGSAFLKMLVLLRMSTKR